MIELHHLCKTYGSGSTAVEALRDVSLTIKDGDIFGIIGLSGAGKSTLIRCINYLERPTSGTVMVNGRALGQLRRRELLRMRQDIGMIFQGFNLLSQRTALKNICYPLEIAGVEKTAAQARAAELLELVGLKGRENAYPSQLSGGQKQRVAIARALATKPSVLLCDEATSALDPNTTTSILALLKEIHQTLGVTIVLITHEMKVIEQICSRVAVMDNSRIVECGAVREVFLDPKSTIARQLILPEQNTPTAQSGGRCLRIVFDGDSAFEPIVSNMTLQCGAAVTILSASTRSIGGNAYGQMLLQLPENAEAANKMLQYLHSQNIPCKEVEFK